MEVVFAAALFSAFAVVSILAFSSFNRFATNIRYETLALVAARQKMDQIQTVTWSTANPNVPSVLTTGTTVEPNPGSVNIANPPSASNPILPLNNDYWNSNTGGGQTLSSAFTSLDTQVLDTRTTVVTPITDASGNTGSNSRLRKISVSVAYTYRGKQFTVTLNSVRASDDF